MYNYIVFIDIMYSIVYDVCVYHSIYMLSRRAPWLPSSGAEVQPRSEDVLLHLNYTDWRNHFDGSASTGRGRLGAIVAQAG